MVTRLPLKIGITSFGELVKNKHNKLFKRDSQRVAFSLCVGFRKRLQRLGYENVTTKVGDGYYGWEEHAPFDAIIVTAAASHIPPPLIKQLKPGGRMVIPVGSRFMTQQLLVVDKHEDNKVVSRQVMPVLFVPVTGNH